MKNLKISSLIMAAIAMVCCISPFVACSNEPNTLPVKEFTEGLSYLPTDDSATAYCVTGIGSATDEEIIIPSTYENKPVTQIAANAFKECAVEITSVKIPQGVTSIGEQAFAFCYQLSEITLPDTLISIGEYAFYKTDYYFNPNNWQNGVLYLDDCLINVNSAASLTVKDGTRLIADYAARHCDGLLTVTFTNSIRYIGAQAFAYCSSIMQIDFPEGLKYIGDYAFIECEGLTSISIPSSVTEIGSYAFRDCWAISEIVYNGTASKWSEVKTGTGWNDGIEDYVMRYSDFTVEE